MQCHILQTSPTPPLAWGFPSASSGSPCKGKSCGWTTIRPSSNSRHCLSPPYGILLIVSVAIQLMIEPATCAGPIKNLKFVLQNCSHEQYRLCSSSLCLDMSRPPFITSYTNVVSTGISYLCKPPMHIALTSSNLCCSKNSRALRLLEPQSRIENALLTNGMS
jgi:hypothetical protein